MATLKTVAGGGLGAGGTVLARTQLDDPSRDRYTQPSVLYGLGTGLLASGLFMADNVGVLDAPLGSDFWASHAITATPAGVFSAAFPVSPNKSTAQQVKESLSSRFGGDVPLVGGDSGSSGSGSGGTESIVLQRSRNGEYGENSKHWRNR